MYWFKRLLEPKDNFVMVITGMELIQLEDCSDLLNFFPPKLDKVAVQFSSVAQLCPTLCNPMDCSTPGFFVLHISWSLLKFMSIESVMPSNHLILCCPLLLLPSIFPSIRVFFFPMSQFFTSGGQSIGVSASASVLPIFRTDFL